MPTTIELIKSSAIAQIQSDLEAAVAASAADALASELAAAASEQSTAADAIATAADRVQTTADAAATAADRAQTVADAAATAADAIATAADRIATGADAAATASDAATVAADKGIVAGDKAIVAADKATVAADKTTVANDKALVAQYKSEAAASAAAAANAVALQFKGGVAGASVPSTSALAGDEYEITSDGTSQSITWYQGDRAIYTGVSGSWIRRPGSVVSEQRVQAGDATRAVADHLLSDGATANRAAVATPGTAGDVKGLLAHFHALVYVPTSNPTVAVQVFAFTPAFTLSSPHQLSCAIISSGELVLRQEGAAFGVDFRRLGYAAFRSTFSGQWVLLAVDFPEGDSTTNPRITASGIDITSSFTLTTAGTTPNWMPTTLDCTKFLSAYNWPAGPAPLAEYGPGAWTVAECLAYAQTGIKPTWWRAGTGSGVNRQLYAAPFSNYLYDTFASADAYSFSAVETGGQTCEAASGSTSGLRFGLLPAGSKVFLKFTATLNSGVAPVVRLNKSATGAATANATVVAGANAVLLTTTLSFSAETGAGSGQVAFGSTGNTDYAIAGLECYVQGPVSTNALQPGAVVAPDSGTNRIPAVLTPGMTVPGDKPQRVLIQGAPMTADGFVLLDQVITPAGYKLVSAYAVQTGTATSTLTLRETSSGGTTVATGALSASTTLIELTVSNGLIAGKKKLHLTNSAWGGNTVQVFAVFERIY